MSGQHVSCVRCGAYGGTVAAAGAPWHGIEQPCLTELYGERVAG